MLNKAILLVLAVLCVFIVVSAIAVSLAFTAFKGLSERDNNQPINYKGSVKTIENKSNNETEDDISLTINYTKANYELFSKIASKKDRLLFFRFQILNGKRGIWPKSATETKGGKIAVVWPSWKLAKQNESVWAPYTDIFAYDVESDSPSSETSDLEKTIDEIKNYLKGLESKRGHKIYLSCGYNYQFGTNHYKALSKCDDVHIHANALLKSYPSKDKKGMDYVGWATEQAKKVHEQNPNTQILFATLIDGVDPRNAYTVSQSLISKMKEDNTRINGFTIWKTDSAEVEQYINMLRPKK